MPLDPQAQAVIDATIALNLPPVEQMTVEQARDSMRARTAALGPVQEVAAVEEQRVPVRGGEIDVRLYFPQARRPPGAPTRPLPVLVYYHGGGWVIGDLDTHDGICRAMANTAECAVANVGYRCAPEFKYPVAAEDACAAVRWIAGQAGALGLDRRRIAVGGDSAGGNLATVVAMMARNGGGPDLALQVLIYPVVEHGFDTGSYREYAAGYLLTRDAMRWFWNHYLPRSEDGQEPYASPLRAPDLGGLPPALVITAEYDPLRDEAEAYAARLAGAGVPVTLTRYPGMIHGFFRMTLLLDQARAALAEVAGALRKAFA